MRKHFTKKRVALLAVLAVGAVTAVGAYAYWTQGGSGQGSATTGTTNGVTVNQTSTAGNLYPGGSAALSGNFDNPNSGSVYIGSVTASVHAFSVQPDGDKPACTEADFSITGTSNAPGEVAAGNGKGSWSGLTLNMLDRPDTDPGDGLGNQDNCKNLAATDLKIDYVAHAS
jgi:hypothetical protein